MKESRQPIHREATLLERLSAERTALSNERTLLAYVRTALAFVAGGASLIFLVSNTTATGFGWMGIFLGGLTLAFGVWRYFRIRRIVARLANEEEDEED